MKSLGETIKELRGAASLRDAANRIGISHTYLDTIEKGYDKRSGSPIKPTPETLRLLSKAYDYSYEVLMRVAGYIGENESNDVVVNRNSKLPDIAVKSGANSLLDIGRRIEAERKEQNIT